MSSHDEVKGSEHTILRMCGAALAFAAVTLVVCSVLAQTPSPPGQRGDVPPSNVLDGENCVEVEIGGSKAFDCLNEKLRRRVEGTVPLPNIPPLDGKSSDIHLGIANEPAVKQQYGRNFGKSVIPYRPAPPVYTPPLGPHHAPGAQ